MGEPVKGTVTSLSSIFPPEEAQKASKLVQEKISEHQKELDQLQGFLNDNTSLVNLVQKLPDQLHHDIMVPFGKAAFFPGRLIHTNEFLEGLVEIREDYIDEASSEDMSIAGVPKRDFPSFSDSDKKAAVEDEEYAHLLSRIDELEKEELEAEKANECEEDDEAVLGHHISQLSPKPEVNLLNNWQEQSKDEHSTREKSLEDHRKQDFSDQFNSEGSKVHSLPKDLSSHGKVPASSRSKITEIVEFPQPQLKGNVQVAPESKNEVPVLTPDIGSSSRKAFTGSIVEHTHNIESNLREQTSAPAPKPVSRFKQQRR